MDNQELQKFIGNELLTVSEAMQQINGNTYGILFLTDVEGHLTGCISDGDIRRYLLAGGSMQGMALAAANKFPKVATSEEEAVSLYHKKNYVVIPIVDEERHIVSVYTGNGQTVRNKAVLNVPVVINAGGKGTRLDPFTRILPKPLIPVGELPIIEHIIHEYQSYGCEEYHVIVNYKKDLIKAYFSDCGTHYNIDWVDEEIPLGTGGGLTLLRGRLSETFFFSNCDALLKANYESILNFHKENGNMITMVCAYKNLSIPYGIVEMGANGTITKMQEKPVLPLLTNTGIYVVEPDVIDDMEDGVAIGFPEVVEMQRQKGRKVAVFPVSENDWMDMGQLPGLEKMREKLYGE